MKTLTELSNDGIKFIVVKIDETKYWHEDIAKLAKKIEAVCLVDLTQPTHLCELAISFPYTEISNFFECADGIDEDKLFEFEYQELGTGYFKGDSTFKIEKAYNDERDFEEVLENEQCNPTIC